MGFVQISFFFFLSSHRNLIPLSSEAVEAVEAVVRLKYFVPSKVATTLKIKAFESCHQVS